MKLLATAVLILVLAGCGGGGGDSGGESGIPSGQAPPISPSSISIVFADQVSELPAGKVASLKLQGASVQNVTKTSIDGQAVAYSIIDDELLLSTSSLSAGSHKLSIEVAGQIADRTLVLKEAVLPTAPAAYLESVITGLQEKLTATSSGLSGAELSYSQSVQAELTKQRAALATANAATLRELAIFVAANGLTGSSQSSSQADHPVLLAAVFTNGTAQAEQPILYDAALCDSLTRQLPFYVVGAAASLRAMMIAPSPITTAIAVASYATSVAMTGLTAEEIMRVCVIESEILNILDPQTRANIIGNVQEFTHERLRSFLLSVPAKISDSVSDDMIDKVRRIHATVQDARIAAKRFLFVDMPDSVGTTLAAFARQFVVAGKAERYYIGEISDARIEAAKSGESETVSLSFSFKPGQMPKDPVTFSFKVMRASDGRIVATQTGRLNPLPLPVAIAATISASPGVQFTGSLRATGQTGFEILTLPSSGVLYLTDAKAGSFTYLVNTTVPPSATDSFTFRARNEAGTSEPVTVTINIDLMAALAQAVVGEWSVTLLQSNTTYMMTVHADGTGVYTVDNVRWPMTWSIGKNDKKQYAFYERGFWHPGYDGLDRDGLTLPVTSFYTYPFDYATQQTDYTKKSQLYLKR